MLRTKSLYSLTTICLFISSVLICDTEALTWPANKCAFTCQNDGLCNSINVCACEAGWLGIDCSIPALNTTLAEYSPYMTRLYSYFNKNSAYMSYGFCSNPPISAYGSMTIWGSWPLATTYPFTQTSFVLSLTMRITYDANQNGFMILFPRSSFNCGNQYGINWSLFTGLGIRFSQLCNSIAVISRTTTNAAVPTCSEPTVASKTLTGYNYGDWWKTLRVQVIFRFGYLISVEICTVSGCFSPFADIMDTLGLSVNLNRYDLAYSYAGVGAGLNCNLEIFEFRIRETAEYIKDYSFLYIDYKSNWNLARAGGISDPSSGGQRLTISSLSSITGSMWTTTPVKPIVFKIDAIIDPNGDAANIKGRGFGIFLANAALRSPTSPFGINTGSFAGLAVMVVPSTNSACILFSTVSVSFDTTCSTGTFLAKATDSTYNLLRRLRVGITFDTNPSTNLSTFSVTLSNGPDLTSLATLVKANLTTNIGSMAPLSLAIGAYNDATIRNTVDVLEVKVYSPHDAAPVLWCKNGGYNFVTNSVDSLKTCICQSGWTGTDCSDPMCSPNCGTNNRCVAPNVCVCKEGYGNRPSCNMPNCRTDCPLHAECIAPNTCKCITGWTGWDCSVASKSLRTTMYWASPIADSTISDPSTIDTSKWLAPYQPGSLDTSLKGIQANGAIRLVPSSGSNRGAVVNNHVIAKTNLIIQGTVEIGTTGSSTSSDGFTIGFMDGGSNSLGTNYNGGSEYMVNWGWFKGLTANIQPSRGASGQVCIPYSGSFTWGLNFQSNCYPLSRTNTRRKFEFTYKIRSVWGNTRVTLDICHADSCLLNTTSLSFNWQLDPYWMYFFIAAENNPSRFDTFDLYEVRTYEMVMCSSTCTLTNRACSSTGCSCQDGWSGSSCQDPQCPNAPSNTICTSPYVWSCQAGWTESDCSLAICTNVPKYGYCTSPNTVTCIVGYTGANCSIPTFITPYTAISLSTQSFTGLSLTSYVVFPSSAISTYWGSLFYNRIADSSSKFNGGMFITTSSLIPDNADFAVNVTIAARKAYVEGSYYGIFIVNYLTINWAATGNASSIDWSSFNGLAVFFWPKTGKVCIAYEWIPMYAETNQFKCQITSTVTVTNLATKVRIGIVTYNNKIWVDVCSTTGCQAVFTNAIYTYIYSLRDVKYKTAGIAAWVPPNYFETIDVYEFLIAQIPFCTIPCANGGTCIGSNVCACAFGWTGATCSSLVCLTVCSAHGVCAAGSPNYCNCSTGWQGADCSIPICTLPCQHGGTCSAPNSCNCPSGWTAAQCQTAVCSSIGGCYNGGACTAPNECSCDSGYIGTNCSLALLYACTTPPCSAYGTCVGLNTCSCVSGWTGPSCSTPTCSPSCANGGTCVLANTCTCAAGWVGATCTTALCDSSHVCVHGTCTGANTCTCVSSDWTGTLCNMPVCSACNPNGGNCTSPNVCTCHSGWAGTDCSIPICDPPCQNGGTCIAPDSCTCSSQWTDSQCTTPVCSPDCQNNGTCTAPDTCSCTMGWTNSTCESAVCTGGCDHGDCTSPDFCTCDAGWAGSSCSNAVCDGSHVCMNGGMCSSPNTCTCPPGWINTLCTTPVCSNPCQNGGTCASPGFCNCTSNWTSDDCSLPSCANNHCVYGNCSAPNTCSCWWSNFTGPSCSTPVCSPSCANGGTCVDPDNCTCAIGWTGSACQIAICDSACLNSGNCTAPNACTCANGWTGSTCSEALCNPQCSASNGNCTAPNKCSCLAGWTGSTCDTAICASSCVNGNCTTPNVCTCASGWTGSTCNSAICNPQCSASNGICSAPNKCSCSAGWTGSTCDTAICTPACISGNCTAPNACTCATGWLGSVCDNAICNPSCSASNGHCTSPNICTCSAGWTDSTCNTAVCPDGCVNGNCTNPAVCQCNSGWTGANCSTPICILGCQNGGSCIAPENCSCATGWNGIDCSMPICVNPCLNEGNCTSPNNCTCPSWTNGTVCEFVWCKYPCENAGYCLGNNTCSCFKGFSGSTCQFLNSSQQVLDAVPSQSDQFIFENNKIIQAAAADIEKKSEVTATQADLKDATSDVVSPGNVNKLVQSILQDPDNLKEDPIFDDTELEKQSGVIQTLSTVTKRLVEMGDALSTVAMANVTDALARAGDKAAAKALQKAIAVESAIIKSDRFDQQPTLACKPLIVDKQKPSIRSDSTKQKLDMLQANFSDFIDGLTIALLRTPLQNGEAKKVVGDFYSIFIYKMTISGLPGFSLQTTLGGADFPFIDNSNAEFLKYRDQTSTGDALHPETPISVALLTCVSNVLDFLMPYNFPPITVRIFTTNGATLYELAWASSTPVRILAKPPNWNRIQYSTEKWQSQCDPHIVQCDLATNANLLGSLVTYPIPSNAGDFVMAVSGTDDDQTFPHDVFIAFNEKPTLSTYTWKISVENGKISSTDNATLPSPRVNREKSGQLRVVILQKAITIVTGLPVTGTLEATPPFLIHALVRIRLPITSLIDDLPDAACKIARTEGFNFRIYRMEPTKYSRRKRQVSGTPIEGVELESNSSETALSFKSQHLGTFVADLLIVPNTIEFVYIFDNFQDLVSGNWIVLATMAVTLFLFLVFLIPLYILDRRDLRDWAFLPIISNSAHETERYLISIHCSACKSYQLVPKVDIRLHGDVTSTEWRCLDDGIRKNFTATRPSNFMLTTFHQIGYIEKMEISVTSQCVPENKLDALELEIDRVIVVDAETGRKYIFMCQTKLGRARQNKTFRLTTEDDLKSFDSLLSLNCSALAKDAHLWMSIFRRPIPSNWTRCERLGCINTALYLAMLTNAMFYGQEPHSPRTGLNVGGLFRISIFTIWTSAISCFIVLPPVCLVAFIFQFVRRRSAERNRWQTIFNIEIAEFDNEIGEENVCNVETEHLVAKPKPKKKKRLALPFWCLFVAWLLIALSVCVSAFLISLYSLQWGQEKSLQWLCGFLLEIVQDFIVVQTGKVFVLAVFNAGKLGLPDDGLDVGKLTFPRGSKCHRISLFSRLRVIAVGLGHHALYVITFALVIGATTNPYAYDQVTALNPHLFIDGYRPIKDTITDHMVVFNYLLYRIIPNFLNGNQMKYGLDFPATDFYDVPNHDVVIIGPIRLRQLRAVSMACPIQNSIVQQFTDRFSVPLANNTHCYRLSEGFDMFSGMLLENINYNGSWNQPVSSIDTYNMTAYQQAWLYRDVKSLSYTGELATYPPGGYYVDLPLKLKDALRVTAQLWKHRWLDDNTTAIFVDFNLYNPQTNIFSVIKIVFESFSAGGLLYRVRRYPLKLYQYVGSNGLYTIIVQSLWIAVLFSHIAKMIYQIKKLGLMFFRKNHWNYLTLANVIAAFIIVVLFGTRLYITTMSVDRMHNYPDEFTDLDQLAFWEDLMFGLYGFGFFMAMIAFFQYLESNKFWAIFLGTLNKGKSDILSYFAFFVTISAIFAGYLYLLVGSKMAAFGSYKGAFLSLLQKFTGVPELTKYGFPDTFSKICSMIYSATILFCGGQMFMSIINKVYGDVNRNVEKETDWDKELATYMEDELVRMTSLRKKNDDNEKNESDVEHPIEVSETDDKTFMKFGTIMTRFTNLLETYGIQLEDGILREQKPANLTDRVHKKKKKSDVAIADVSDTRLPVDSSDNAPTTNSKSKRSRRSKEETIKDDSDKVQSDIVTKKTRKSSAVQVEAKRGLISDATASKQSEPSINVQVLYGGDGLVSNEGPGKEILPNADSMKIGAEDFTKSKRHNRKKQRNRKQERALDEGIGSSEKKEKTTRKKHISDNLKDEPGATNVTNRNSYMGHLATGISNQLMNACHSKASGIEQRDFSNDDKKRKSDGDGSHFHDFPLSERMKRNDDAGETHAMEKPSDIQNAAASDIRNSYMTYFATGVSNQPTSLEQFQAPGNGQQQFSYVDKKGKKEKQEAVVSVNHGIWSDMKKKKNKDKKYAKPAKPAKDKQSEVTEATASSIRNSYMDYLAADVSNKPFDAEYHQATVSEQQNESATPRSSYLQRRSATVVPLLYQLRPVALDDDH